MEGIHYERMRFFRNRRTIRIMGGLLAWSLLVMGCARTTPDVSPQTVQPRIETVAFTATIDRVDMIDAATSVLVSNNFTITLANDRIGLLQTDFVSLSSVRDTMTDSLGYDVGLNELLMRITVNAEVRNQSTFVQVKGATRRIAGVSAPTDDLQGLYWLDRVAQQMADVAGVSYVRQLSDSTYSAAMEQAPAPATTESRSGIRGAAKAGGILLAVIFAVTLAVGTFGPGSNKPAQTE